MKNDLARVISVEKGLPLSVKTKDHGLLPVSDVSSNLPFLQSGDWVWILFSGASLFVLERIEQRPFHQAKYRIHQTNKQTINLNEALIINEEKGITMNRHIKLSKTGQFQVNSENIHLTSKGHHFKLKAQRLHIQTKESDHDEC